MKLGILYLMTGILVGKIVISNYDVGRNSFLRRKAIVIVNKYINNKINSIRQVARISAKGLNMPQSKTDFFPSSHHI